MLVVEICNQIYDSNQITYTLQFILMTQIELVYSFTLFFSLTNSNKIQHLRNNTHKMSEHLSISLARVI